MLILWNILLNILQLDPSVPPKLSVLCCHKEQQVNIAVGVPQPPFDCCCHFGVLCQSSEGVCDIPHLYLNLC